MYYRQRDIVWNFKTSIFIRHTARYDYLGVRYICVLEGTNAAAVKESKNRSKVRCLRAVLRTVFKARSVRLTYIYSHVSKTTFAQLLAASKRIVYSVTYRTSTHMKMHICIRKNTYYNCNLRGLYNRQLKCTVVARSSSRGRPNVIMSNSRNDVYLG